MVSIIIATIVIVLMTNIIVATIVINLVADMFEHEGMVGAIIVKTLKFFT